MHDPRDDLMDESVLRRSLRLEPDERAPRFDARVIALLAGNRPLPLWTTFSAVAGLVVMAGCAIVVWSVILAFAPALLDAVMSAVVDVAIRVVTALAPVADIAVQPAIPLSLLAALGVAILHELRERREQLHANAS